MGWARGKASGGAAGSGSPSSASHGQGGGSSRSRRPRLGPPRSRVLSASRCARADKVEACGPARLKGRGSAGPRGSPPHPRAVFPEAFSQLGCVCVCVGRGCRFSPNETPPLKNNNKKRPLFQTSPLQKRKEKGKLSAGAQEEPEISRLLGQVPPRDWRGMAPSLLGRPAGWPTV